jgi:hypothetical protein
MKYSYGIYLILLLMFSSCEQRLKQFTLLPPERTGITFRNTIEETEEFNHLHYSYLYNGAGVAVGDINKDGLPDIYFTGNLVRSRLYLNRGNFRFKDISENAGVSSPDTWNNGATMADVNGDGFLDIYVCSSTDGRSIYRRNKLYINNGDLTFTDMAEDYGLEDPAYSTHSAFLDYDKDGDLDLFVINHSLDRFTRFNADSPGYKNEHDPRFGHKLFRNDGIRFTDVSEEAGIVSNVINFGLGIAVADFNNDHWPDIYVCNDFYEQDYFFINQKNGTFSEQLGHYFNYVSFSSMGNDAADVNNDGYIDLITLDMLPEKNMEQKLVEGPHNYEKLKMLETEGFYYQTTRNMLHLNSHGSFFSEIGQYAGINSTNWSWSPLLCDFNNDGLKDLFISNGYGKNNTHMDVIRMFVEDVRQNQREGTGMKDMEFVDRVPSTILKNYMFMNNGDLRFENVGDEWGFEPSTLSNGAAYADLDNDGDMDLVISNINKEAFIYRNNSESLNENHYLRIRLEGKGMNTSGIGTRIELICGSQSYTQEFYPSRGYMSSVDHVMVFGLGHASSIDQLTVTWPDLTSRTLRDIEVDQTLILRNENGVPAEKKTEQKHPVLFTPWDGPLPIYHRHMENDYIDFTRQPLLPGLLSTQGPCMATADVNGDGLGDLYIGGARGFPGTLYVQAGNGTFTSASDPCFDADKVSEDMGALFVDVDGDTDPDLYVVSGGNETSLDSEDLQDRLYLNDGAGHFTRSKGLLPRSFSSGSCVKSADMDLDGDLDLFIGGRLTPGLYPTAPRSFIMENDGKGKFHDVTGEKCKKLLRPGMVTDALWSDFSGDGLPDLILVGEWMAVRLFLNTGTGFEELTGQDWMNNSEGWWNTLCEGDFDGDGDTDYALGNQGQNFQIKVSVEEPATLYAGDLDRNGSMDAVMCHYILGENYPIYSRDDLAAQIPQINVKYPDYRSYADQTITDIFSEDVLNNSTVYRASNFNSSLLQNLGNNRFMLTELPQEAQFSPVYHIGSDDYNNDGYQDLLLTGNFYGNRIKYGRLDSNPGLVLLGDGGGNFTPVPSQESGLMIRGEVRDKAELRLSSGLDVLLFALNNDSLRIYLRNKPPSGL